MLPWDDRAYDEHMPLTRIGSLLPYHSHVDPETVTGALNRMIDDADNGNTVFYRFYAEAQRREEPARSNTGLFFFRGRPGAPFAVISPSAEGWVFDAVRFWETSLRRHSPKPRP